MAQWHIASPSRSLEEHVCQRLYAFRVVSQLSAEQPSTDDNRSGISGVTRFKPLSLRAAVGGDTSDQAAR